MIQNLQKTIKKLKNKKLGVKKESKKEKNVNLYHKALGNPSENTTRLTAKFYNVKLTRN